jgi:hypothetical protein
MTAPLSRWTTAWIAFLLPAMALAQSDTLRVRSFAEASLVDSLWSDSLWVWNGPCDGAVRSFRFEFPDSTYCRVDFPCALEATQPTGPNAPLTAAVGGTQRQAWTGQASITRIDMEAMGRKLVATSCFPPASSSEFAHLLAAMEGAVFESEKCAVLGEASARLCWTRPQMHHALSLIPSEDRRLEIMERISRSDTEWTEPELRELFQLNFILERALKRFAKR